MLSFVPMFALAYIAFLFANLFGWTGLLFTDSILYIPLPSGKMHNPTNSYLIVIIGIVMLFIELLKATKTSNLAMIDHVMSTFVFIAFLVTYLIAPWAGNSVFLTFTFFSLLDVIAGFTITISGARRDFGGFGK